jgi:hypothetical protein
MRSVVKWGFVILLAAAVVWAVTSPEDVGALAASLGIETEVEPAEPGEATGLNPGDPVSVNGFTVVAGGQDLAEAGYPLRFESELDNEVGSAASSEGQRFVLVPVRFENTTDEQQTWPGLVSWKAIDKQGKEYPVEAGIDMYLEKGEQLDLADIEPHSSRRGYLVFEVDEQVTELTLLLETNRGSASWQLKVD